MIRGPLGKICERSVQDHFLNGVKGDKEAWNGTLLLKFTWLSVMTEVGHAEEKALDWGLPLGRQRVKTLILGVRERCSSDLDIIFK